MTALGTDSVFLVALFIVIPISLFLGYSVRVRTNFDYPKDFVTALTALAVLVALWRGAPVLWCVLFAAFYLIGHRFGKNVNDKDKLELVRIYKSEDGNICLSTENGEYFKHREHGLCKLPETNGELFNQLFRGIYHKVETNAPLDANIVLKDIELKDNDPSKVQATVRDDDTGLNAILIEDIETIGTPDAERFLKPTVPRTVIRLARGSAIPKARTLFEFDTIDRVNENLAKATAETLRVKTEIIPALPGISASQLVSMAEDHPVFEVIRDAMANQEGK